MVDRRKKCQTGVIWISGFVLILSTISVVTKLILGIKSKVGKNGE